MSAGLFGWVDGWHDWMLSMINMISYGGIYKVTMFFYNLIFMIDNIV